MYERIYSPELISSLPLTNKYRHPFIVTLCKSKNKFYLELRELIEKWYSNLNVNEKSSLKSRLISLKDDSFFSAFFELMLFQYFKEEKVCVDLNKVFENKTPDIFVAKDNQNVIIEVDTIIGKKEVRNSEGLFDELLKKLDKVEDKYRFDIHLRKIEPENIDYKKLVSVILDKLKKIPKKENIQRDFEIDSYGFKGTIYVEYDKSLTMHDERVVSWGRTWWGDLDLDLVRDSIRKKIKKYKPIIDKNPFVVAVCNPGSIGPTNSTIESALFGQLKLLFEVPSLEPKTKLARDNSGLIVPRSEKSAPLNTSLSAVLYIRLDLSMDFPLFEMKAFHNPWAKNKLNENLFYKIPQLIPIVRNQVVEAFKWRNGSNELIKFNL